MLGTGPRVPAVPLAHVAKCLEVENRSYFYADDRLSAPRVVFLQLLEIAGGGGVVCMP